MGVVSHISVFEKLGQLLNTREAATDLLNYVRKSSCRVVELNFSNVDFMSRSFADQLYKEQQELQNKSNIAIHFVDANEEIINIIRTVKLTQYVIDRKFVQLPVYKFTDFSKVKDYLLSI